MRIPKRLLNASKIFGIVSSSGVLLQMLSSPSFLAASSTDWKLTVCAPHTDMAFPIVMRTKKINRRAFVFTGLLRELLATESLSSCFPAAFRPRCRGVAFRATTTLTNFCSSPPGDIVFCLFAQINLGDLLERLIHNPVLLGGLDEPVLDIVLL